MTIKAACITFPGSNCDQDMHRAVNLMGWSLTKLWHTDTLQEKVDLMLIPGGFSYGDYLRSGALAKYSKAIESVKEHADRGGFVLGVCNGFQILCETGLLPGALTRNSGLKFKCIWTDLITVNKSTAFSKELENESIRIPIAHGEGNYQASQDTLKSLQDHDQIAFTYASNPNGSVADIAGVYNKQKNILGMMPHPERAIEDQLGGSDGLGLFKSLDSALKSLAV